MFSHNFPKLLSPSKHAPLRTLLIVPFAIQIMVVVGLTGWLSFYNGHKAVESLVMQLQKEIAARLWQQLFNCLEKPFLLNQLNAKAIIGGQLDKPKLQEHYFFEQLKLFDCIGGLAYSSDTGEFIAIQRDENYLTRSTAMPKPIEGQENITTVPKPIEGKEHPAAVPKSVKGQASTVDHLNHVNQSFHLWLADDSTNRQLQHYRLNTQGHRQELLTNQPLIDPRQQPWYTTTAQSGKPHWGSLMYDHQGWLLPAYLPIYQAQNQLVGIVTSQVYLSQISQFLKNIEVLGAGSIFIMEHSGTIVASSTLATEDFPADWSPNNAAPRQRPLAINSSEPLIRASAQFLTNHFGTIDKIVNNQLLTFYFEGKEQFIQITPFTLTPGIDWLIVSIIPELEFMMPLHHNTYLTLLLSFLALISALLIGMVTTKWILKPIWQLDTATQQLSRVQWCQQKVEELDDKRIVSLTLNTTCWIPSELENLAQTFNRMAEQLKHSFVILRESENKLTQFLEAMPVGILITDAQGKLYYTNQRAQQIFTQDIEAYLEKLYVAGTQQPYPLEQLPHYRALRGETVAVNNIETYQTQGTIPLEVWAKPIYDNQGKIIYSISVIQDISDRKRAESEKERFTAELRKLNKAYERFIPREFIKLLDKNSILDIQLGDQVEKEMTILFSDIRGFTSISESMQPPDIFDFINNYLGQMEPIILHHHGVIDKYIGDAIMALFPTCVEDAINGSIAMLRTLDEYNQLLAKASYPQIKIGIGLNTGPMMIGTIGGQSRMDGTVIADAVNVASRVEGLTKTYGSPLLITEQTYLKIRNVLRYYIRVIDRVKVKGKSQFVTVYEIFDADPPATIELKKKTLHNFEQGFMCFHHESYDKARQFFAKVLEVNEQDEAAKIYLSRCRRDFWTSYEKVMRRLDG